MSQKSNKSVLLSECMGLKSIPDPYKCIPGDALDSSKVAAPRLSSSSSQSSSFLLCRRCCSAACSTSESGTHPARRRPHGFKVQALKVSQRAVIHGSSADDSSHMFCYTTYTISGFLDLSGPRSARSRQCSQFGTAIKQ